MDNPAEGLVPMPHDIEEPGDSPGSSAIVAGADAVSLIFGSPSTSGSAPALPFPGAVFRVPDSVTGFSQKVASRPVVAVTRPITPASLHPSPADKVRIVMRVGWKEKFTERFGRPPDDMEAQLKFMERLKAETRNQWLFSPAGFVKGLDRHGIFDLTVKNWLTVEELIRHPFLGAIPKPWVYGLTTVPFGVSLSEPYPPLTS